MPSKTKKPLAELPTSPKELIDQFVTGSITAETVNAAPLAFKRALIERALGSELSHHLGSKPGTSKPTPAKNQRNGVDAKTVLTDEGSVRIEVPREREGTSNRS
jgi:putative transposase